MKRPLFMVCLCLILVACLRLLKDEDTPQYKQEAQLDCAMLNNGQQLWLTGRVYKKDRNKFYLKSITIHDSAAILQQENSQQTVKLQENLICEYDGEQVPKIGSVITVHGFFAPFSKATNPGEFDSRAYYMSLKIGGKLRQSEILYESEKHSVLSEALYELKQHWKKRLYSIFPEKEASVMCTMLLGETSETDKELKALYKRNGIIHILSISGLHITIVGISLYNLLRKSGIPTCVAASIGGGILLLYGLLTGMSISAVRAIGMYLLKMLSHICKRTYDMLTALGVMGALMALQNPEYLCHAGFLLSFGAVLGIGVLYPVLAGEKQNACRRFSRRYHGKIMTIFTTLLDNMISGIKQSVLSGLSVSLTTLPILLWFYYEVPVYSMLLNLLIIPFMSMVLCFGLLAMLLPGLGVFGTVDCVILWGYEWLCRNFERLPYHTWNPGRPQLWQVLLYYTIWLLVVLGGHRRNYRNVLISRFRKRFRSKKNGKDVSYLLRGFALTAMVIVLCADAPAESRITFLDVGQGDCICIQTAFGETYLFDCGSSSRDEVGRYVLLPFLKYSGIRKLDGVFVSHEDSDHKNGIDELLSFAEEEGITIEQLYLPGEICAGECVGSDKASILCLHPAEDFQGEDNESSQCFYVELWDDKKAQKKLTLLLTGDVEGKGERLLIEQLHQYEIKQSNILKVAHHGSRYATSESFLQQLKPQLSVISCGRNNSYGHPHENTLERLTDVGSIVLTTPDCGAIMVSLAEEIKVRTFLPLPMVKEQEYGGEYK